MKCRDCHIWQRRLQEIQHGTRNFVDYFTDRGLKDLAAKATSQGEEDVRKHRGLLDEDCPTKPSICLLVSPALREGIINCEPLSITV